VYREDIFNHIKSVLFVRVALGLFRPQPQMSLTPLTLEVCWIDPPPSAARGHSVSVSSTQGHRGEQAGRLRQHHPRRHVCVSTRSVRRRGYRSTMGFNETLVFFVWNWSTVWCRRFQTGPSRSHCDPVFQPGRVQRCLLFLRRLDQPSGDLGDFREKRLEVPSTLGHLLYIHSLCCSKTLQIESCENWYFLHCVNTS